VHICAAVEPDALLHYISLSQNTLVSYPSISVGFFLLMSKLGPYERNVNHD